MYVGACVVRGHLENFGDGVGAVCCVVVLARGPCLEVVADVDSGVVYSVNFVLSDVGFSSEYALALYLVVDVGVDESPNAEFV